MPASDAAARLCRLRANDPSDEVPFRLDPDGFLVQRHEFSWEPDELSDGALVTAATAATSGTLVLLGEPGVGKTTVLRALTADLRDVDEAVDGDSSLLWLDGTDLTDNTVDRALCQYLEQLPAGRRSDTSAAGRVPTGGPTFLTIVIDQLDESVLLNSLAGRIRGALKGRDTAGLRWLIACRAVDYPTPLTRQLEADGRSVVVADLAPMTRGQAVTLASEFGVDGEALVAAAVEAGAGALASIPLTLRLLADLSRAGALAGTAKELFHRSVRQLLSEPSENRRSTSLEGDQLFAVAARIACRLVLSGRRTVWTGHELARERQQEEIDVRAGTLVGGQERTISGTFPVTAEIVHATLTTAVFAPRGTSRLALSHSSIAAYLAAWHLHTSGIPEHQLRALFLAAADDGSTSIPSPLRETAAWLVTLEPTHAGWLAEADPRSLASYSSLVDNASTRQALVQAMLRSAGELELSELPWQLDRTRLSYPGLADDLTEVLSEGVFAPEPWPDRARARLAVRLAHHAEATDDLVEALLSIAESSQWDAHERRLAIDVLEDSNSATAVGRLRRILDVELADPSSRAAADPDDEIRGGILLALWPRHLSLADALRYAIPQTNTRMAGAYAVFLHDLPARVEDEDLPMLLRWVARCYTEPSDSTITSWEDGAGHASFAAIAPSTDSRPSPAKDMIEPLLDRATAWHYGDRYMKQVAELVWPVLHADDTMTLPEPLAVTDSDGVEPSAAQRARRALCLALCRHATTFDHPALTATRIVHGWTNRTVLNWTRADGPEAYRRSKQAALVEQSDFAWLLQTATEAYDAGDRSLAMILAHIASGLLEADDRSIDELAFAYEHTPLWEALRGHFDPIPLDSGLARAFQRQRTRRKPDEGFAEAEALRREVLSLWDRTTAGDTTAFWLLLWHLQFDPTTGRGQLPTMNDDPRQLPGTSLLEPAFSDQLPAAAAHFVESTNDQRAEWLGTGHYDKRAWAGYLALALLDSLDRTPELGADVWAAWVGAILWFTPASRPSDNPTRRRRLLEAASDYAFSELDRAIPTYTIGEIDRGSEPNELNLDDLDFVSRHQEALNHVVNVVAAAMRGARNEQRTDPAMGDQVEADVVPVTTPRWAEDSESWRPAVNTLGSFLRALLSVEHPAAVTTVMKAIRQAGTDGSLTYEVICAEALLRTGAVPLSEILDVLIGNSELSVQLANHVSTRSHNINRLLDEAGLGQLLIWLEPLPRRAGEPGQPLWTLGGVGEWRSQTLRDLTNRRSPAALEQLNALNERFPDQIDILAALVSVRTAVHALLWRAPRPDDVASLLADSGRRLVRTNRELADLVAETLDKIAGDLPTHGEVLWDRQTQRPPTATPSTKRPKRQVGTWRPKLEATLCAYIAHELRIRLHDRGVAINREVLVQPTDPYGAGERTDILIESFPKRSPHSESVDDASVRLAVVIEAKGQWNRGLEEDLVGQLAERYLPEVGTDTGIYLVGWFPLDQWDDTSDSKRLDAKARDLPATRQLLLEQASNLHGKYVTVQIIEVPRPQSSR
ncbi:hypothetical protein ACQPZJ_30030 [Actinoplanes sp. CA-054009]